MCRFIKMEKEGKSVGPVRCRLCHKEGHMANTYANDFRSARTLMRKVNQRRCAIALIVAKKLITRRLTALTTSNTGE